MTIEQQIFDGRVNTIRIVFAESINGAVETPVDFAAVTRMVLHFVDAPGTVLIDSDDEPTAIDWDSANTPTNTGTVILTLGESANIPSNGTTSRVRLIAYDSGGDATELLHEGMPDASMQVTVYATTTVP